MRTTLIVTALIALLVPACAPNPRLEAVPVARPAVLGAFNGDGPVTTAGQWHDRRAPALLAEFERHVFGRVPDLPPARVARRETLKLEKVGAAVVEQWEVRLGESEDAPLFNMILALPPDAQGPAPLIVAELFCGNRTAVPGRPEAVAAPLTPVLWACESRLADPLIKAVLGRRINGPPIDQITRRGYALALFYPGDVAADEPALAAQALQRLQPDVPPGQRGGAIAAWAALYGRAVDVLAADPRIDPARIGLWGHSRHGKAVLLAAALDKRPAAFVSHQSGRGGASLNRSPYGETIAQITEGFPHWFGAAYGGHAADPGGLPVDQHQLVALAAPRPLLVGYGRADKWSDPVGGFRAVEGAAPAWALLGSQSPPQPAWDGFDLDDALVFYRREGRHGVTTGDWNVFLDFYDRHMPALSAPPATPASRPATPRSPAGS